MDIHMSLELQVKLGSLVVHFDEYTGPDGHEIDLREAQRLLSDPEVVAWLDKLRQNHFLPVKRVGGW